jgi:LemA protein
LWAKLPGGFRLITTTALAVLLPVAALAFIAISAIFMYNSLILSRNRTREAWSGIDVQLKRRSSLIPNLVETVRGYAGHEHAVFSEVAQARSALMKAAGPAAVASADQGLNAALGRLMAVAESYPQLQAVGTFSKLQEELSDTEEKVAYARQIYNRNALDFNTRIQTFPGNQFANLFHFEPVDYFNVDEQGKSDVKVQFTTV